MTTHNEYRMDAMIAHLRKRNGELAELTDQEPEQGPVPYSKILRLVEAAIAWYQSSPATLWTEQELMDAIESVMLAYPAKVREAKQASEAQIAAAAKARSARKAHSSSK